MANFLLLLARRIAAILKAYFARVSADGGTVVDRGHTKEVYADVIDYEPTLIQSCDSGSAGNLYSLFVNPIQLLDNYTGSAAAYSLRSLSESTTNVVKVRRSGDDAELDFTASEVSDGTLAAWVVAGGGTEDGFVTTWYDQSGNANNATQATAANQPKIVSSGTLVTENGKAAVDFDGTDDNLNTSAFEMTSAFSVFGAFNMSATSGYRALISHNFVSAGSAYLTQGRWLLTRTGSASQDWQNGDAVLIGDGSNSIRDPRFVSNGSVFSANTQYAVSGVLSNTTSQLWANGSASTARIQETASITSETGKVYIGSSELLDEFQGTIQEVILYDSDQSANRTGIEANINAHYNIYP